MKRSKIICAIALFLGSALWITQYEKNYPLTTIIDSLLDYKDHTNRLYYYGSDSGFSRRPSLIGDYLNHLAPSEWKISGHYFNHIRFGVGEEMMEVYVFHMNGVVDRIEINVSEKTAVAGNRMKTILLDQFPDIRCLIVYR